MATSEHQEDFNQKSLQLLNNVLFMLQHPGRPCPYGGRTDMHSKVDVRFGNMRADLDVEIAVLVFEVWRAGGETLGSCQNYTGSKAYIQFAARELGGAHFIEVAERAGVPITVTSDRDGAKINFKVNGGVAGYIQLESIQIHFAPEDIRKLAAAYKVENDANNRHGKDGLTALPSAGS